jgi:hypothetical protein
MRVGFKQFEAGWFSVGIQVSLQLKSVFIMFGTFYVYIAVSGKGVMRKK